MPVYTHVKENTIENNQHSEEAVALAEAAIQSVLEGKTLGQWIDGAVRDTGRWTNRAIRDTKHWVGNAAKDTGKFVTSTANQVGKAANNAKKSTAKTIQRIGKEMEGYTDAEKKEHLSRQIEALQKKQDEARKQLDAQFDKQIDDLLKKSNNVQDRIARNSK